MDIFLLKRFLLGRYWDSTMSILREMKGGINIMMEITGKATIQLKPDTTQLFLRLQGIKEKYEDAMILSAKQTDEVKSCLKTLGIDQAKTTSFKIEPHDIRNKIWNKQEKVWEYRHEFDGYQFTHSLIAEFPYDMKFLGKVIGTVANCSANPRISFSFTVKDPTSAKNELLRKAVTNAKEKAALLAEASGVKLARIVSIDYSWGEIRIQSKQFDMLCQEGDRFERESLGAPSSYDVNIDPEDIELTDTVTMTWEIE